MEHSKPPTHVYKLFAGPELRVERVPQVMISDLFQRYDDTGWEPRLEFLYKAIECSCVDTRRTSVGRLWFDDNGKFAEAVQLNPIATMLYQADYDAMGSTDYIAGHAVLVCSADYDEKSLERTVKSALMTKFTAQAQQYEAITVDKAMELAQKAHAEEDYAVAAACYWVAAEKTDDPNIERQAHSAFMISIDNLHAHVVTQGEGW